MPAASPSRTVLRRPAPATPPAAHDPGLAASAGVPARLLPPHRMPPVHARRPLKRWRYVGVYGADLMLCAGRVSIGGAPQAFSAVWDREHGTLYERTRFTPWRVRLPDGACTVRERDVRIDLRLTPDTDAVEVVSPHGAAHIWTRKQGAAVSGSVTIAGRERSLQGRAFIDDSAGYHARVTDWEWAAGVGTTTDGVAVMWNLVTGVHDAPAESERAIWVDGAASEVGPVTFSPALDEVAFAEGRALGFHTERERARHDRIGPLLASDYRQPFGTVTGTLPGGHELAEGYGVMERHHARW